MSDEWRSVRLDRGDHGLRVDRVLLRHLQDEKRVSRNQIQKWIDAGDVLVNGVIPPRAAWRVQAGDDLRVRVAEMPKREKPRAEAIPVEVLYEDDDLLAVNKPAGIVVHPSYKNTTGTLMNGLLDYARSWPAGSTPALLGRLDKLTSGLVIVTKRPEIHAALQRAMAARRIDKDYLAIVRGKPSPARGTIDLALDRDPWDRRRITVTDRGGQPSVTRYERVATSNGFSLVRCRLITGRTHQIRVHLSAKKWPIIGDAAYGDNGAGPKFPRQALHSWRIAFRQPKTGRELVIEAPLPDDMRALADSLGLSTSVAKDGSPS
ncbi:MAG TPA: RluA family pseudouridine synthase [Vicinamibacterales bacterium]|nr:RluA family pseudouridine synthase [Vicinamibacterales bacterium]